MKIDDIQKNWNDLASEDALWTILTHPEKKGRKWGREEFFVTGREQVDEVFEHLAGQEAKVTPGLALDFGCGVGRLTQALGERFAEVHGVDVSSVMIDEARRYNRHGAKVKYFVNARTDLQDFAAGSYDFILTDIVLQHIPTEYQKNYIADFFSRLKPGGVAVFGVIHARSWRRFIPDFVVEWRRKRRFQEKAYIPMNPIGRDWVTKAIARHGCFLKARAVNRDASMQNRFEYHRYVAIKR